MVTSLENTQPPLFTPPYLHSFPIFPSDDRRPCTAGAARSVTGAGGVTAGTAR